MAKVNIYKDFFEKNVVSLLKPDQRKGQTKLAYYLKLYTNFMSAESRLTTRRGFDHLRIARFMTEQESYPGEAHYLRYINSIARSVLSNQDKILKILKKDPVADPLYAKSQLLMAQNICVLRILKISKG
mgnify:CR=1 FL=1